MYKGENNVKVKSVRINNMLMDIKKEIDKEINQ